MKDATLQALFLEQLRDMYHMERQLVRALPQIARRASSADLQTALADHLEQTHEHVRRLEEAFEEMSVAAKGKACVGMQGILEEGKEVLEADWEGPILDAGIIAACQKVEHYEIASYGAAHAHALVLGLPAVASLLEETLGEERAADAALNRLAAAVNRQAAADGAVDQTEGGSEHKTRRTAGAAKSHPSASR